MIGVVLSQLKNRRVWLVIALLVVLVLLALGVRAWRQQAFQWDLFLSTFRKMDLWWVGGGGLFAFSTYLGRALRWKILIASQKRNVSLRRLFVATAIGFTAIVLFGRPGEFVRPYLIAIKERLSFSSQVAALVLERIYDLMMALFIFGFSLSRVRSSGVQLGDHLNWVLEAGGYFVALIALLCVVIFIALRQFGDASKARILAGAKFLPGHYYLTFEKILDSFAQGVQSTRDWKAICGALGYSVVEWGLIVGSYVCIFRASPVTSHFTIMDVMIFVGFVAFGNVIQIPGVGGGLQIVSVLVLTELFGIPLELSSGLAVILWAITFVVIVPFGLALAFHDGLNWKKLRHLKEEAPNPE